MPSMIQEINRRNRDRTMKTKPGEAEKLRATYDDSRDVQTSPAGSNRVANLGKFAHPSKKK